MKLYQKFFVLCAVSAFAIGCGEEETSRPTVTFPMVDMGEHDGVWLECRMRDR